MTTTVTTAILTTASMRAIYKQYIAQGRDEQDALKLANSRGFAEAVATASKKPAAPVRSPARKPSRGRSDCVRGWEHDVE